LQKKFPRLIIAGKAGAMTSIVLAGGKGKRLGDKLSKTIGGRTLLQRVIDSLGLLSEEILVVIAQGQSQPAVAIKAVVDLYPGGGALGGIYSGLVTSRSLYSLVIAGDMPFLNPFLLRYLIQLSPGFDVVIPRIGGKLEPLHAIYSKNCLAPIQQRIEQGDLKVGGFLEQVRVRYVEEAEIDKVDPKHLSFFNINTLADLRRARAMWKELKTL
jgi:molybdopterin-guanine dinucleotide biosynthesis protein A